MATDKQWKTNASLLDVITGKAKKGNSTTKKATVKDWFVGNSWNPSSSAYNTKTNNTPSISIDNTYDTRDYIKNNTTTTGGSGGYYTLDVTNMLKAYDQQAQADRAVAKSTYESKRSDLLTSLKRFQEQNAKDVERTQRTYLSDQASLESAIAQADRQNRINASARGLGGSGLQQLAQLQNLLSQGQNISDMATENQETLETLRNNLANYEEDTNKSLKDILDVYNNNLNSINAQLATNKANAEVARANSYVHPTPGASNEAEVAANANSLAAALSGAVDTFKNSIGAIKKKKRAEAYDTARQNVYSILETYGYAANTGAGEKALKNLKTIYKNYK